MLTSLFSTNLRAAARFLVSYGSWGDQICWGAAGRSTASLHDVYVILTPQSISSVAFNFCWVWKLQVPMRIKFFWWRVLWNSLPCKGLLSRRHLVSTDLCRDIPKELNHVLVACPLYMSCWILLHDKGELPFCPQALPGLIDYFFWT